MASRHRWGICGVGKISADFATALLQTEGAIIIAAAASSDKGRSEAFASTFAAKQGSPVAGCGSYAELLGRDDVDVVYVGTVNTTHFSTAMAAIEAGKAVVCEKPVGINGDEAEALATAAKEKGVFFMEGMWSRFLPATVKAREIIASGALGKVVAVHADFGFRCDDAPSSRMFDATLAGGGLLDIGIYPLAFASMAFGGGAPASVAAAGTTHAVTGVDTSAGVTLVYEGALPGAACKDGTPEAGGEQPGLAMVTYNLRGFTPEEVIFVGTEARLVMKGPAHVCEQLVLTKPDGRTGMAHETLDLPLPAPDPAYTYNYPGSEGFQHEIAEVQRCLAAKALECPAYTHAEMVNIARTMDEVRKQLGVVYPGDAARPAKKLKA